MRNLTVLIVLLFNITCSYEQTADIILFNGKIFTSDEKGLFVDVLAIQGNRILATGNKESVEKYAGTHTQQIDLQGKTVTPGFNDAHYHLESGFKARAIQIKSMDPTWESVLDSLRIVSSQLKNGEWIQVTIGSSIVRLLNRTRS